MTTFLNRQRGTAELVLLQSLKALLLAAVALLLCACSTRQLLLQGVADELASQDQTSENDLLLARESSAFYLKLSESVLRQTPGHLPLAQAVAGGFTQYAYAFVAFEADRIEAKDARQAQVLRERAARLYRRAQRHALAALEQQTPGFAKALANPDARQWPMLQAEQIGVAYWAAASWGGLISLSKDDPDTVADLPLAVRLASLAWHGRPDYGGGALASLMGSFELARPGGSSVKAQGYFDQAIELGGGKNAGAFVAKAEGLALPSGDRAAFESLLRQALLAAAARSDLSNEVMRARAQWLLDSADDLF